MSIEAIGLIIYAAGWVISYHWLKRLITEDEKYRVKPAEAYLALLIMATLWPVTVPSHLIFLLRKKISGQGHRENKRRR